MQNCQHSRVQLNESTKKICSAEKINNIVHIYEYNTFVKGPIVNTQPSLFLKGLL